MKRKKIFDAVTNIPDALVEEAAKTRLKKPFYSLKRRAFIAACLTLIVGFLSVFAWLGYDSNRPFLSGGSSRQPALSGGGSRQPALSGKPRGLLLNVMFPKAYAFGDYDARRAVLTGNPVDDALFAALNDFSYKTAAQIFAGESGNINYSPLSLYYALAMAASGAGGETAGELLFLLGMTDKDALAKQCGNLYRRLYLDNKIGKLQIGNSLWMDKSVAFKDDYIKSMAENFYAHAFSVDFSDAKTGRIMAEWVSERTNNTLAPDIKAFPDQMILSLINTVYFRDEWTDKFEKSLTAEDVFYLPDSKKIKCDFMNKTYFSNSFGKGDGFIRSSLDLINNGRMVFILPDEGISPRELLSSAEKMKNIFEKSEDSSGKVVWQIPKFSFDCSFEPADTLRRLGVRSAFEADADFSGITDDDDTAFISKIQQDTHIGIDENGVEASAFTRIDISGTAAPGENRADMILNRPFIYGITAPDGTILFVGICENPKN